MRFGRQKLAEDALGNVDFDGFAMSEAQTDKSIPQHWTKKAIESPVSCLLSE